MGEEQFETLLRFFQALGNESRLRIMGILANGERGVGELADLLDLKEPTVSHHLLKLKELELVTVRPEGNNRLYSLNRDALEAMNKEVFSAEKMASLVENADLDAWERKVLQDYLDGERIKQLPSKRKKLMVILDWLIEKFEVGVKYTESQVNEIIEPHHPDFASLRREFIDTKMMQRDKGVYWRIEE